jgi:hypothetical protein
VHNEHRKRAATADEKITDKGLPAT